MRPHIRLYKNVNISLEVFTNDLLIIDKAFMTEAAALQQRIYGFRSLEIPDSKVFLTVSFSQKYT